MCIIIVKKRGINLPDDFKEVLFESFQSNRDGAGLMLKRDGSNEIYVEKGFMVLSDLLNAVERLHVTKNDEFVVHCRIATHGSKNADNTHPFIVSKNIKECVNNQCSTTKTVIAHNGIFSGYDRNSPYSDTCHFTRECLALYNPKAGRRKMAKWRKKFSKAITGQKLAIMYPDHCMELLGPFIYYKGMFYSNSGFKAWVGRDVYD